MLNIIPIGMILGGIIFMIFQMVGRILKALNRLIEACNHFELGHINKVSRKDFQRNFRLWYPLLIKCQNVMIC